MSTSRDCGASRIGRTLGGVAAWVAAVAVAVGPLEAAATQPGMQPDTIAEEYQKRGDELYDRAEYLQAARTWARILDTLSENEVNRAERDNALLITLDAYSRPFEPYHFKTRPPPAPKEVVDGLREGVMRFDAYVAAYKRAYGPTASISPSAQEVGDRIKQWYAEAGGTPVEAAPPPPSDGKIEPPGEVIGCDRRTDRCYQRGVPLIVVGSISLALGLGATSMIVIGGLRAAKSGPDRTSTGLIAGGSVATVALLVAGGTMLGVGLRRRGRRVAWAPTAGPGYAGLSVGGRF